MLAAWVLSWPYHALGQRQELDTAFHHVRNTGTREWATFPEVADKQKLIVQFVAEPNREEHTLSLRQYDVKLTWDVVLNGKSLGSLVTDEKDMVWYLSVPPNTLRENNTLEISCASDQADDIRVGNLVLHTRPRKSVLSDARVEVDIRDDQGNLIPARITIVNDGGILQTVEVSPGDQLAARPGYVYTGDGTASFYVPEGRYTLYAGRGFEYGIDSAQVAVTSGTQLRRQFTVRREVSTNGWVSSDTHIHTFTWSRHGDASVEERALTIAGEGLELPIITDHNLHIDLAPVAVEAGVGRYFTPVTGNEVTTGVGHFNVFPVKPEQSIADHRARNWKVLAETLGEHRLDKAVILNHARDIHAGFRPFDPRLHLSSAGMRLDGWELPANAMEIINSGAQQTDQLELTRDWFGLLNHGHFITPVGASDSHDVSRYIVGQGRTYIRCNDDDPAHLDVGEAVRNFREGNVMVSFGLLAGIEVNDTYGPGELVPGSDAAKVSVKVSGPAWSRAERVILYANGRKIREEKIQDAGLPGIKWSDSWNLTLPGHDVFLVAVAIGPDRGSPVWPIGKPYQPRSIEWSGGIFGVSGAVWLDADRNGKRNSARDYAETIYRQTSGDIDAMIQQAASYDEAVAIQLAALLHKNGKDLRSPGISTALRRAAPATRAGFEQVIAELELAGR